MFGKQFWKATTGYTSLQAAMTFAVVGVVASLTALPYFENSNRSVLNLSQFVTGQGDESTEVRRYTITQSVLQKDYQTGCTEYEDGTQEGSC